MMASCAAIAVIRRFLSNLRRYTDEPFAAA
jgi:hypothetical protein